MRTVEEALWKNPGGPAMFVFSAGKHDGSLFEFKITSQAAGRIKDFRRRAENALKEDKGFVVCAEPAEGKSGWGILRVGYIAQPNLAAIGSAVLDLDQYARAHPDWSFRMSFPGIEHIAQEAVEPVISILPNNVTACVYMRVPQFSPAKMDVKDVYWLVKNHLMYGQHELARSFLQELGWENIDDQIAAVARKEREPTWKERRLLRSRSPTA